MRPLLMFHGLASTPKEFGLVIPPLRRAGIAMHAPELAGYSAGRWSASPRWQAWVDEATEAALSLIARHPGEPIALGGLCTGAMIAVAVAARLPAGAVDALALMSPLFAYDGWGLPRWYALRPVAYALGLTRLFSMAEREPYGLMNERMRRLVRQQLASGQDSLAGPARVPLAFVRESERLSREARALLPRLPLRVLVQHARLDEICSLESVRDAVGTVPAFRLRLEVIEDSYHMITADNGRERVARQLIDFLRPRPPLGDEGAASALATAAAPTPAAHCLSE